MEHRLGQIQTATEALLRRNGLSELVTFGASDEDDRDIHGGTAVDASTTSPVDVMQRTDEHGTVDNPMSAITAMTVRTLAARPLRNFAPQESDLIAQDRLSAAAAQDLFDFFNRSMNQYLWGGIAMNHSDLNAVRQSSILLSTVVLTIASLHLPDHESQFDLCYHEFVRLVAQMTISRRCTFDDVRALILGAFWFPDLSWKLSGLAIRVATELDVHRHFTRYIRGDESWIEGARLWFLLYVCDHHFSVAYGRPSMVQDTKDIRSYSRLLDSPQKQPQDERLLSQVALFICLSDIYQTFGVEVAVALSDTELADLQHRMAIVDQWRLQWELRLGELIRARSTISDT